MSTGTDRVVAVPSAAPAISPTAASQRERRARTHRTAEDTSAARAAAIYQVGTELYDAEDYVRAADLFRFVALSVPTFAPTWWALAACHEHLDDYAGAATLYDVGYRLGGEPVELALLRARASLACRDYETAAEALDEIREREMSEDLAERVCRLDRQIEGAGR